LQVTIAELRVLHSRSETILLLDLVHLAHVLVDHFSQAIQECLVTFSCRERVLWHDSVEGLAEESESSVGEVTQVGEKLIVVLGNEIVPEESGVLLLGSVHKQVISPYFYRDASLLGVISKHTSVVTLREFLWFTSSFINLIVEVFSRGDTLEHGPWLTSGEESRWEDYSVEGQVIFTHELVKLDILFVLPPLLPLIAIVGGDRDVADRSIEPNVKDFVCVLLKRNWSSPLEVTGDASLEESSLQEVVRELRGVGRPVAFDLSLGHPAGELVSHLGQVDVDMLRLSNNRSSVAHLAVRVLEFRGVDELTASITLISLSTSSSTSGVMADSIHKPIS
jgi:hypothetical protein